MKIAGSGRLRWYCTPCQKQCRDANSFKQHTLSESHTRRIDNIRNVHETIDDFFQQFQISFLRLLQTSYQEKSVHSNRFYQTYIADKHHIHLNSTRWSSLAELIKHLGREGLCRTEEKDDGLYVAWIDRSPEAVRRTDALKKRDQADAASKTREDDIIKVQIERAHANRKPSPTATSLSMPLPTEPGPAIAFQLTTDTKGTLKNTGGSVKKVNAFKTAKQNLQEAKKRKQSEAASTDEPPSKRS
ncbi:C2H2-type domain-containing protein [Fusarium keratoplasticum]|uniref:C2H2-type domain-containing protein n=1 Tax=Fusarium keratoplasticum TaxID=1328300 RepID=A0ACC0QJX4_9HYPO|nr:C2H2-type domain-containing protein [Fusarium keratoplasticum]KAI8655248.1 C2H2-type domain-containing protein [Fusarium keratoplasticum]KAI8656080.1 C2H2-type domain-containing protein [Fusarium keratoplasticum]